MDSITFLNKLQANDFFKSWIYVLVDIDNFT